MRNILKVILKDILSILKGLGVFVLAMYLMLWFFSGMGVSLIITAMVEEGLYKLFLYILALAPWLAALVIYIIHVKEKIQC